MEKVFEVVFSEYGLAMCLSVGFNVVIFRLYQSEKADRKEAWRSHNELVHENNEVLQHIGEALVRLQERIR